MTATLETAPTVHADAFTSETLFAEHRTALHSYVRTILSDHHAAEDIVQETLLRAWKHEDRLRRGEGAIRGWLLRVARNLALDRLRSATRRSELSVADHHERDGDATPDHADHVALSDEVSVLLDQISEPHRQVLVLTYFGGLNVQQVAETLSVPVGTVKSRRHYALNQLRASVTG